MGITVGKRVGTYTWKLAITAHADVANSEYRGRYVPTFIIHS